MDDIEKQWDTSSRLRHALCTISKPSVNSKCSYSPETTNSGQNRRFLVPCDLEVWQMTMKNKRAPPLCSIKVCASFHSHQRNQTGVTIRKFSTRLKIVDYCRVWPWNLTDDLEKIGPLFYATSNFVHNFIAIGEFELELHSGNAQSGSKSAMWSWNLMDKLKNNRASCLWYVKPFA